MKNIPPRRRVRVDMLPLMDMIFLLLVLFIFMIVQMRPDFGIGIELPHVGEALVPPSPPAKPATVTISLTRKRELFVNDAKVPRDRLAAAVRAAAGNAPPGRISVVFRADRRVEYGHMIQIFALLRHSGLRDILFDLEPDEVGKRAAPSPSPR